MTSSLGAEPAGSAGVDTRPAVELGVNLVDTADSYGPEVSERLIAESLYPYPQGLVIATKAGLERPGPDRWKPNGRLEHLRAACEGSLRRLRLERIDLYQLYRIDPEVPFADQLGTFKRLQEEGKVRHVGLSAHCLVQVERMSSVTRRMRVFTSGPYASLGSLAEKSSRPPTRAT